MTKYAVTFTLKPKWYVNDINVQANLMMNEISRYFERKEWKRIFILELTVNCNVHCHGILEYTGKNINRRVPLIIHDRVRMSKILGFSCVKENIDKSPDPNINWLSYIKKSIDQTKDDFECKIHPVFIDDFSYFFKKISLDELDFE